MAIRGRRFLYFYCPPRQASQRATTGKTHQAPVLHRCRCLGSPRALQATRAALPPRTTLAGPPPAPLAGSPSGKRVGEAAAARGPARAAAELTHLVRRRVPRLGGERAAGLRPGGRRGAGPALPAPPSRSQGRGEPCLSRHRGYSILHHERRPLPHARLQPTAAR